MFLANLSKPTSRLKIEIINFKADPLEILRTPVLSMLNRRRLWKIDEFNLQHRLLFNGANMLPLLSLLHKTIVDYLLSLISVSICFCLFASQRFFRCILNAEGGGFFFLEELFFFQLALLSFYL